MASSSAVAREFNSDIATYRQRICVLVVGLLLIAGCGPSANVVFDLKQGTPLADGRPVIEIQPNGKERPDGTGPFGDYILLVRRNGEKLYARQFDKDQASNGVKLDLALPKVLEADDELTVAVENFENPADDSGVRLSNVLEIPVPPATAPSLAVPPVSAE